MMLTLICVAVAGLGAVAFMLHARGRRGVAPGGTPRDNAAAELGLRPVSGEFPLERLQNLPLMNLGQSRSVRRRYVGESCGATVEVLDFFLQHQGEGTTHEQAQTIVLLTNERLSVPAFSAVRKSRADRWLAPVEDRILVDPTFCKSWVVDGEDEEAVHALFTEDVMKTLQRWEFCVEGRDQRLVLYRQGLVADVAELEAYLEAAYTLSTLLCVIQESADWQTVPIEAVRESVRWIRK